jgi:hypothetical protein
VGGTKSSHTKVPGHKGQTVVVSTTASLPVAEPLRQPRASPRGITAFVPFFKEDLVPRTDLPMRSAVQLQTEAWQGKGKGDTGKGDTGKGDTGDILTQAMSAE